MASSTTVNLPKGAWDSHIHVIDTINFKMLDDTPFTPKNATVEEALAFERSLGIDHVCVIATSVYGTDNACLVDALQRLGGKARGIAYIDPATVTDAELDRLHGVGVRGVRLNLWTRGQTLEAGQWPALLASYAERLRRLDWVLQIFVSMDQVRVIAPFVPTLGVKVVFDHLGCPNPGAAAVSQQPGCAELYDLLAKNDNVYIKMSGDYRFPTVRGLDEHMRKLVETAPDQIVWASDWPHTTGVEKDKPDYDPKKLQDFLTPDVRGFLKQSVDCCGGDESLVRKIWVENPRRLWDYTEDD